jgi:hypothetical protein
MDPDVWRIHAWGDPDLEAAMIRDHVVAVGGHELGDLSYGPALEDLRHELRERFPDRPERGIANFVGYWRLNRPGFGGDSGALICAAPVGPDCDQYAPPTRRCEVLPEPGRRGLSDRQRALVPDLAGLLAVAVTDTGAARGNGRDRGRAANERTCADKPPPRPCRLRAAGNCHPSPGSLAQSNTKAARRCGTRFPTFLRSQKTAVVSTAHSSR